jgi:hypothetical protein
VPNNKTDCVAVGSSLNDKALLGGILIFTALLYLPTLNYHFVYDDQGQIVDNALVRAWRFVPEYFQSHVWQYLYPNALGNYYRPLNVLWFRINDALFGLKPMGWHASAVLLHLLATALAFLIVRRVTDRPLVAAVTALLFGIHPTRHEVVAWVSGTTESLLAVLFLGGFLAYLASRERRTIVWMSVSCFFYAASLLAKETAAVLPALVFAHSFLYGLRRVQSTPLTTWQRFYHAAARASVYIPIAILYLVIRVHVLHGFSHAQVQVSVSTLLLTLPSVLFFYLKQWLLPIRMTLYYDLPFRTHWDLLHVALPLVGLGAVAVGLWFFRRRLGTREMTFALAAMVLPLLPVLYVSVLPIGELVHDRYTYLPGLGAALLVGLALQPLYKGRLVFGLPQRLVLVMLPIIVALSYSTANASSYWVNEFNLFEHAHRLAPENILARNNYAIQIAHNGDQGTGIAMMQKLVDERPGFFLANYNLGRLLYEANLLGAAEHYLQVARNLEPDMPDTYSQLGLVYLRAGRWDDAARNFRYATALRPRDATLHFALGVSLAATGNCAQGRSELSAALLLDPELTRAKEQMDKCVASAAGPSQAPGQSAAAGLPVGASAADQDRLPSPRVGRPALAPVKGP